MIRQGDVLLIPRDEIPDGLKLEDGCVLAYGEATGHAHEIADGARIWVDVNDRGRRYLEILNDVVVLRHHEHGHVRLLREYQPVYEIVRQVEYTPHEVRRVSD